MRPTFPSGSATRSAIYLLGLLAALKQRTLVDSGAMFFAIFGVAMPNYLIGILLIYLFSLELHWLPATGQGMLATLVPAHISVIEHVVFGFVTALTFSFVQTRFGPRRLAMRRYRACR